MAIKIWLKELWPLVLCAMIIFTGKAHAACTSPSMPEGSLFYNSAQNVPQVCAGDSWVALGALNPGAGSGVCSNPTMIEGSIFYNDDFDVLQYCDGENWIAIAAVPEGTSGGGTGGSSSEKIVFVTSGSWNGNLGGSSALTDSDSKCQTEADNAGLAGNYKVWLGHEGNDPDGRFLQASVPYKLVDGTTVADDWADLVDGTLTNGITLDASGTSQSGVVVWTYVSTDGTEDSGDRCPASTIDWNNTASFLDGNFGTAGSTNSNWTDQSNQPCNQTAHLYCFEQ
jgi:hypothetical protein